jgi:hypothetical protein
MTHASPDQRSLLEELEARQDEVLNELDQLNERIEALINECLGNRDQTDDSTAPPSSTELKPAA